MHSLKSHLEKNQKDLHSRYLSNVADRNKVVNPVKKARLEESRDKILDTFVQQTLAAFQERLTTWPDDHASTQRIDKCIMDMIIVDMLPYSIVEGDAFKRLNFADPVDPRRFRLKTKKYFRTTMMPATYEKVCGHVTKLLVLQGKYMQIVAATFTEKMLRNFCFWPTIFGCSDSTTKQ